MQHQPACLFILCVLTGSACAVFYTKSTDNDYPRIGRRSFYTGGNGNHYPRIGRRDASSSQILLPGLEFDLLGLDKRGVFTQSAHGSYPRVGRGSEETVSGEDYMSERRNKLLERITGLKEESEEADVTKEGSSSQEDSGHHNFPLAIMFTAFDSNSDGQLTKEEFSSGMNKYRLHNPLC